MKKQKKKSKESLTKRIDHLEWCFRILCDQMDSEGRINKEMANVIRAILENHRGTINGK